MPDPILENMNEKVLNKKKKKRVSNSYTEQYPALTKMAWGFDPSLTPASNEVATHLGNIGSAIYGGAKGVVGTAAGAVGEAASVVPGVTDHLGITDGLYDHARAGLNSIWYDVGNNLRDVARPFGGSAIFGGKGIYEGSNNAARMKKHTKELGMQGIPGKIGAGIANIGDWGGAIASNALPFALASPALAASAIALPAATQATALGTDIYQGHKKDALIEQQWPDAFKRLKAKLIKDNPTATPDQISDAIDAYEKQRKDSGVMPKDFVDSLVDDEAGDGAGIFNKITDTLGDWGQSGASALGAGDWYKSLSPTMQAAIPALLGAGGLGIGGYALYKMLAGDDDEEEDEEEQRRQALQEYYNQYYKQSADAYPALTKAAESFDVGEQAKKEFILLRDNAKWLMPGYIPYRAYKYLTNDNKAEPPKNPNTVNLPGGISYDPTHPANQGELLEKLPPRTVKLPGGISYDANHPMNRGKGSAPASAIVKKSGKQSADAYPALTKAAEGWQDYVPDFMKRKAFESDPGSYITPELQKTVAPIAKTVADFTGVQGVNTAANAATQSVGQRAGDVYSGASQQNKDIAWKALNNETTSTAAAGQYAQNAMNNPGQAASDAGNAAKDFVWGGSQSNAK